jgi:hypothetical protein
MRRRCRRRSQTTGDDCRESGGRTSARRPGYLEHVPSPASDDVAAPDYVRVAYLQGGRWGVTRAVLASLHAQGALGTKPGGHVVLLQPLGATPRGFERIFWNDVFGAVAPGALASRPKVQAALEDLRRDLIADRLIRRWLPGGRSFSRTARGGALLSAQRDLLAPRSANDGSDGSDGSSDGVGMQVAMYGNEALLQWRPAFARESGLLSKASSDDLVVTTDSPNTPSIDGMTGL